MTEIPEHLLKRSQAAKDKATGESSAPAADTGGAVSDDDGETDADDATPFGPLSHAPLDDPQAQPEGYPVKGNADSMKYHAPGGRWYDQTVAEVWFATTDAAEAAGFTEAGASSDAADDEAEEGPADAGEENE